MPTALIITLLACIFVLCPYTAIYYQQVRDASILIRQLTAKDARYMLYQAAFKATEAEKEFASRCEIFDRYYNGDTTAVHNFEPTELWQHQGECLRDTAVRNFESVRRALASHPMAPTALGNKPLVYLSFKTQI